MSTAIAIPQVESSVDQSMEVFNEMAKSSDYLPRLQLLTGNSGLAQSGEGKPGEYVVVTNKTSNKLLGVSVVCWPLGYRHKALNTGGETPIASFDVKSPVYAKIRALSAVKDSGCMYGPEFLLFIPEAGFCTYHMSSKTARNVSPSVQAILLNRKPMVLTSKSITKGRFKWHGPEANESSVFPEQPDGTKLLTQLQKFLNPSSSNVEMADTPASSREQ